MSTIYEFTPKGLALAKTLIGVINAILETVQEANDLGHGVPGGHIYNALMTTGMSLHTFESIMLAMVQAGKLERRGQLYYTVKGGAQ